MTSDIHWQQRFSTCRQALAQLETFFEPPALNEQEGKGLIKAFESTLDLPSQGYNTLPRSCDTLRKTFRLGLIADGEVWILTIQDRMQQLWAGQPRLQAVRLLGSRAMGRHGRGSDVERCLEGRRIWAAPATRRP